MSSLIAQYALIKITFLEFICHKAAWQSRWLNCGKGQISREGLNTIAALGEFSALSE